MQDMKRHARILTIGEVLDMDWENGTRRLAAMVNNNMLHSQLQYALYGASARVFLGPDGVHTHEVANTTILAVSLIYYYSTVEYCVRWWQRFAAGSTAATATAASIVPWVLEFPALHTCVKGICACHLPTPQR
jgi:hypothetical protein